ncbi:DUF2141 domain-containing protein [Scytonema hofmannii FACHB-248]|uniref:DUF2141 domain-containing protein n=1 Tax=Scytonema hofmannii FACHB-248 TaxID=1842502 RepID=A0ABR8GQ92_9CYAN|nr:MULTISPECIES: DUF2141 domain-containing protein [Nostocales]MBD2605612.1 DUF2141 domain-containing protein [Scytonema hofmannii FACHB-248]
MLKLSKISSLLIAILVSASFTKTANAQPNTTLTVVVNGIEHQKGQLCIGIYSNEKGFPLSTKNVVKSACKKITGTSIKQQFTGMKPGNYAVAVVDDQNGDRQLNRDFFGIPKEGFGISNNPTVSITTGTPKFSKARFSLLKNTTVNIDMKYGLDP